MILFVSLYAFCTGYAGRHLFRAAGIRGTALAVIWPLILLIMALDMALARFWPEEVDA